MPLKPVAQPPLQMLFVISLLWEEGTNHNAQVLQKRKQTELARSAGEGEGGKKVFRAPGTEMPMRNAVWFKAVH